VTIEQNVKPPGIRPRASTSGRAALLIGVFAAASVLRCGVMSRIRYDDDGAVRMSHHVLAHRAEQCPDESAMSSRPHHEKVGAFGGSEQHLGGMSLDGFRRYHDVWAAVSLLTESRCLGSCRGEKCLGVERGIHPQAPDIGSAVSLRVLPSHYRVHGAAVQSGLLRCPAQSSQGPGRTIQSHHEPTTTGWRVGCLGGGVYVCAIHGYSLRSV